MKRREFITLLGGAAVAWPLAARGQQQPMPVIGRLQRPVQHPNLILLRPPRVSAEAGYFEGRNLAVLLIA